MQPDALLATSLRGELVPNFDFVPIGISKEHVGLSGDELAAVFDLASSALDRGRRLVDVAWVGEAKAEMLDTAGCSDSLCSLFEDQYVVCARSLRLEEMSLSINGNHPEDVVVELERSLEIAYGQREVGQSERFYHRELLRETRVWLPLRPERGDARIPYLCQKRQPFKRMIAVGYPAPSDLGFGLAVRTSAVRVWAAVAPRMQRWIASNIDPEGLP
jgi:hypothetical protein